MGVEMRNDWGMGFDDVDDKPEGDTPTVVEDKK